MFFLVRLFYYYYYFRFFVFFFNAPVTHFILLNLFFTNFNLFLLIRLKCFLLRLIVTRAFVWNVQIYTTILISLNVVNAPKYFLNPSTLFLMIPLLFVWIFFQSGVNVLVLQKFSRMYSPHSIESWWDSQHLFLSDSMSNFA